MPFPTATTSRLKPPSVTRPSFGAQCIAQHAPLTPLAMSGDTVRFGNGNHETDKKSFWKDTPVVKHLLAGTKEGFTRLFKGNWKWDIGVSAGLFILTLPLALIIPGSHLVLIPAYIGLARAWHGTRGFGHGLFHPDEVLKNKK